MNISWKPTAEIIPYARNNKIHTESQIKRIAGSIKEFGFKNPILITTDNVIIAGHGRILAAEKLGYEKVPCIVTDDLTETQIKAYRIADNKLASLAEWDEEMLSLELSELKDVDFNFDIIGFDIGEVDELFSIESTPDGGARGSHYNDEELPEIEPYKQAYRIEAFTKVNNNKCIELFTGRGALTYWYRRNFKTVITNDKQKFSNIGYTYNLDAKEFIKRELVNHLDFNYIDFDDEGCPAEEIQEFFKIIKNKKKEFVIAITDGMGLNLKCLGKINFYKTYLIREDKTVQPSIDDYYNYSNIFKEFMEKVATLNGFKSEELSLHVKNNGNVIYATYLIKEA